MPGNTVFFFALNLDILTTDVWSFNIKYTPSRTVEL